MASEGIPQNRHKSEDVVAKPRRTDVLASQGRSVPEAVRSIPVTPFTLLLVQGVWRVACVVTVLMLLWALLASGQILTRKGTSIFARFRLFRGNLTA